MTISYSLPLFVMFCLATIAHGILDYKYLPGTTAPDGNIQDATTKLLTGKFKDVADKESCQLGPLSNKNEHTRTRRVPMIFEQPLKTIPQVIVSVTNLLAEGSKQLKYETQALDVTTKGFTLEYKVFSDAAIDNVEVQWMALG